MHKSHSPAIAGDSHCEAIGGVVPAQADFGTAEVKAAPAAGRSQNESSKECGLHKSHSPVAAGDSRSEAIAEVVPAQADFGTAEVKAAPAAGRSQNESSKECGLHATHQETGVAA